MSPLRELLIIFVLPVETVEWQEPLNLVHSWNRSATRRQPLQVEYLRRMNLQTNDCLSNEPLILTALSLIGSCRALFPCIIPTENLLRAECLHKIKNSSS